MRKKKLLAVSLLLVILQIVSLFAMIPASAATTQGRSYTIYKANVAPTADGGVTQGEDWDNVPWSENFVQTATGEKHRDTFSAKFKAMWVDSETTTDLWIYLYVNDVNADNGATISAHNWLNDYFSISVDSNMDGSVVKGSEELFPGYRAEVWDIVKNGKVTNWSDNSLLQTSTFSVKDKRSNEGYYSAEICIPIPKTTIKNNQIKFDILVNDCTKDFVTTANKQYSRISWNGDMTDTAGAGKGIGTFSSIPASAVGKATYDLYGAKEYTIYNAGTAINVDGNAANDSVWENAEWGYLTRTANTNVAGQLAEQEGFSPKFKAMWYKDGQNAYLYLLIDVNDTRDPHLQSWLTDGFQFAIDETAEQTVKSTNNSHVINCSTAFLFADTDSNGNEKPREVALDLDYQYIRDENGYTVEAVYQFVDAENCDGNVRFDLFVQDSWEQTGDSGNCYARYSYGGIYDVSLPITKGAIGILSPYASAADEPISTEAGAGTRLNDPAGLRFESRINKAKYDALVDAGAEITTGTLVVPTDYLTEYGINNSNFTKANLDVLKVEYLDVVNNGWVNSTSADTDGYYKYYGSIVGIKTANLDRNFSGIGYMTVKTATEEYTVYGGYRAADHARSVQYVAAAAIASGEYNDYLTTLQSFIKDSAPAKADGTTYRIMQYNLMKDGENWGGIALEIPYLASSVRKNITSAAIEGYNPDILVVNERFEDTWSELGLSNKYKIIGETTNRNAIVYNSDVFEEVVKSGSKAFTESDGVNNRNVSYAILKDGEQLIAVFATHWGTDSANHASQLADMQSCMSEVLTGEYADIPVVIAGDFNSLKNGTEYTTLLGTTYTDAVTSATSVDHIAVKGFSVVGQGMDTKSYTKFASDHKPIYADIKIGG